jgi:hypothetical protein
VRSLTLVFTDDECRAFDVIYYNEGKIEVVLFCFWFDSFVVILINAHVSCKVRKA